MDSSQVSVVFDVSVGLSNCICYHDNNHGPGFTMHTISQG